jgi:hypothetical protein
LFSIVAWIGLLPNLYFAFPAFFVPSYVVSTLGLEPDFDTVWLRNAGLLIFIISAYHILAAMAPARYTVVAWMVVGGRLAAAVYWLIVVLDVWSTSATPAVFLPFVIGDVFFGSIGGVLLYLAQRGESPARAPLDHRGP